MPVVVPESEATAWDAVSMPAPLETASIADGGPLNWLLRRLVGRSRWVRNVLLRENGDPGIKRCRVVSSITQLRALTDHQHGDFCLLMPAASAPRVFYFSVGIGGTDDGAHLVKPDDVPSGNARWVDPWRLFIDSVGRWQIPAGMTVGGDSLDVAGSLNVQGTATFEGNLNSNGNASLQAVDVAGAAAFNGTVTCNSSVTLAGGGSLRAPLVCSISGRVRPRQFVVNTDANLTIAIGTHSVVRVPAGVWSTNRTIFVETIGAGEGDEIEIFTEDAAHLVTVADALGNDIIPASLKYAAGLPFAVTIAYSAGAWHLKRQSKL